MNSPDPSDTELLSWSTEKLLDAWPIQALQAMLGSHAAAVQLPQLPLLWHWLYFLQATPREQLGQDGHPRLDDTGVAPRRMFAAVRTHLEIPLRIGARAQMSVSVVNTRNTVGKSGPLRIVTFEHRYMQDGQLCIVEQRDIVYLSGACSAPTPAPFAMPQATWRQQITPDAVMLMRMSALTFNAHRIHYDQQYAQQVEGYPERVVHAPLTALLLMELVRAQVSTPLRHFECRARSPLFVDAPMELLALREDKHIKLLAVGPAGLAMEASVSS